MHQRWTPLHGQKCIACACDECHGHDDCCIFRMQFPTWVDYERDRGLETALFRCSQRDSTIILLPPFYIFPQCISLTSARTRWGRSATSPSGRVTHARSTTELTLSLCFFSSLLFFFLVTRFVIHYGLDIPAALFFFFHFFLFRAPASLPRFRRYPRETKGFSSRYTGPGSGY